MKSVKFCIIWFSRLQNILVNMWNESLSVASDSLWSHGLYSPWNSPGQNTGVGSLSVLQGIFPTQGLNPGLPQCRQILYQLSPKWSPRILEWVAYPVSSGSSWPRNWTGISCVADGFFTNWATREALIHTYLGSSPLQVITKYEYSFLSLSRWWEASSRKEQMSVLWLFISRPHIPTEVPGFVKARTLREMSHV